MKGRINGSGLGFTSGFVGGSPGKWRLALSTSTSLWDRDLSIKRRVTTDIDYKLLLRGIHTTRIMTTTRLCGDDARLVYQLMMVRRLNNT